MGDEVNTMLDDLSFGNQSSDSSKSDAQADEVALSLDAIFGGDESSKSSDGKRQGADGSSDKGDPFNLSKGPRDVDAIIRQLQSERDSNKSRATKLDEEVKQYKPVADFLTSLYEDQNLKEAFIAEIAPDLVKTKDPLTFVQESIKKEFGDDFTPSDDPKDLKTMLYNERLKELYGEYKARSSKVPTTLAQLREQRKKERESANMSAMVEKKDIMVKHNWTDDDWGNFAAWANKVKLNHMATIYDNAVKKPQAKAPYLANQSGKPLTPNALRSELDQFFGPTRNFGSMKTN